MSARNVAAIAVLVSVLAGCSGSGSGPVRAGGPASPSPSAAVPTGSGPEDYPVKACRYLTVRDIAQMFPAAPGMRWQQQTDQPSPGECHWSMSGSTSDPHHPRDDLGLIISARAPQFGPAPPASEPTFDTVPPQLRDRVKAAVRRVRVGAAAGWFQPYYLAAPGSKVDTHLDLSVGQYDLSIYADTSAFDSQYQQVEDAATAGSDLAAAKKIAEAVIARLPAAPPPP